MKRKRALLREKEEQGTSECALEKNAQPNRVVEDSGGRGRKKPNNEDCAPAATLLRGAGDGTIGTPGCIGWLTRGRGTLRNRAVITFMAPLTSPPRKATEWGSPDATLSLKGRNHPGLNCFFLWEPSSFLSSLKKNLFPFDLRPAIP